MINKITEITNKYIEKDDFSYSSILQCIIEMSEYVKIGNLYFFLINPENDQNLKRIYIENNQIILPETNLEKSIIEQFRNENLSHEEIFSLFKKKSKKTNKIVMNKTVQDKMIFLVFFELEAKSYNFFIKNYASINLNFSSLVLKYLTKLQHITTNPYSGISLPLLIDELKYNILICNSNDDIIFCNKAATSNFGEGIINTNIELLFKPEDIIYGSSESEEHVDGRYVYYLSKMNKYFEVSSQKMEYNDLQDFKVYITFDVTQNELNKKDIKEKQDIIDLQLRAFDEFANIDIRNEAGEIIYNNKKDFHEKAKDYTLSRLMQPSFTLFPKDVLQEILTTIKKGEIWKGILKLPLNNDILWYNSVIVPLYAEDAFKVVTISINITNEKKQQEEILKLASVVEFSPISILITDKNGNIEFVNPKYLSSSGLQADQVLGRSFTKLGNGYIQDELWLEMLSTVSNGKTWEGILKKKSYSNIDIWESVSISSIMNDENEITNLIVMIEDVTDKLNLQNKIYQTNNLLETINDTTQEGIIVFDRDGNIIMKNNKFLKLTDLSFESIYNLKEDDIFNLLETSVIDIIKYGDIIEEILSKRDSKVQTSLNFVNNKVYELNAMPFEQGDEIIGRMWTLRDITERAEYEEKLKLTNYKLEKAISISDEQAKKLEIYVKELEETRILMEKAANIKSEFIANISHEIRTPLNSIIGYADILYEEKLTPKQNKFLLSIINSGKNLLLLINDILEISRYDSIDNRKVHKPIYIDKFIQGIYQMFLDKINPSLVDYKISLDEKLPRAIFVDEVRLRQILINIIGNAIKFTSVGEIEVKFKVINSNKAENTIDLVISISDTGIGIPQEKLDDIFNPFYQVNSDDKRKYRGSGIGLTLVKKLVDIMNGEIKVTSKVQIGTNFEITLKDVKIFDSTTPLFNGEYGDNFADNVTFKPASVIVCDDIIVNITLVKSLLRNQPIKIFNAISGTEAIEIFKKENIDLVLMDYSMEDMNGDTAAKIIKNEINPNAKIILLSAASYDENLCNKEIFDDFLDKPFSKEELFDTLKKFLDYEVIAEAEHNILSMDELKIQYISVPEKDINLAKTHENEIIDLYEQWNIIAVSRILGDIKKFSYDLQEFSIQNNLSTLRFYADILDNLIKNYDIEKMNETLSYFPNLIKKHNIDVDCSKK